MEKLKKKVKSPKPKKCEYRLPNCQKTPDFQLVFRLFADVNLAKYWACHNCADLVEREMKAKQMIADFKRISKKEK